MRHVFGTSATLEKGGREEGRLQLAFLITCKTFKAQVTVSILALSSSYEANSPKTLPRTALTNPDNVCSATTLGTRH